MLNFPKVKKVEPMTEEIIKDMCRNNKFRWTKHVLIRLAQRNISMISVKQALLTCEIIEQYPADHPFPSCLVLGVTLENKHLHIVCGSSDIELWIITAYSPDLEEWFEDLKTRREHN